MIIFIVYTFVGIGIAGIARALFFSELSSTFSASTGLTCGFLAMLCMAFLNFIDLPLVLRDWRDGTLIEASVACQRAVQVSLTGINSVAVALDCGDNVLVLVGDWWLNVNTMEIWESSISREQFPAQRFRIQYLPRSGQVVSVHVDEGPLEVDESDPIEPTISLNCSRYAEVVYANQPFHSLVRVEDKST